MTHFMIHEMKGIVTLPSYHTVLAIIFIYVFRGFKILFPLGIIVNVLMLLSTPGFGGHYLVDMIAGGVITVVTIYFVRSMQQALSKDIFVWRKWGMARRTN